MISRLIIAVIALTNASALNAIPPTKETVLHGNVDAPATCLGALPAGVKVAGSFRVGVGKKSMGFGWIDGPANSSSADLSTWKIYCDADSRPCTTFIEGGIGFDSCGDKQWMTLAYYRHRADNNAAQLQFLLKNIDPDDTRTFSVYLVLP